MHFYNPAFLWALFAIAIPVLIHLFNLRKYKIVYFSNVRILQQLEKDTRKRSTLQNLLILLIRVLTIATIVLLFARPYFANPLEGNTGTKYVGIYIDNSMSMEAQAEEGQLLDVAKTRAATLVQSSPAETRYALISNQFELKHNQWINKEQALEWISAIDYSNYGRKIDEIQERFNNLVTQSSIKNKVKLYYFSDFQESFISPERLVLDTNILHVAVLAQNTTLQNISIDSIWFESPGHYAGKVEKIFVKIQNRSDNDLTEGSLQLHINDSLRSLASFTVSNHSTAVAEISYLQKENGVQRGKVSITDYPITFDNQILFTCTTKNNLPITIISEDEKPQIAQLFAQDSNFNFVIEKPHNVSYDRISNSSLIIVNQLSILSSGLIKNLSDFCDKGGTIFLIPPMNAQNSDYNKLLSALQMPLIGEWIKEEGQLSKVNLRHRLLQNTINEKEKKLIFPVYKAFYALNTKQNYYSTIAQSSSGAPLIIEKKFHSGNCIASLLPFVDSISDISTHPLIVPLLYNAALQSGGNEPPYYTIAPSMTVGFQENEPVTSIELLNEKGSYKSLPTFRQVNGVVNVFPEISELESGIYSIKTSLNDNYSVAFNYSRNESDTKVLNKEQVSLMFEQAGIKYLSFIDNSTNAIIRDAESTDGAKSPSMLLIIFAIGLLIAEQWLVRKKSKSA